MTYKKRILFVGEASFLNTGFSTYYRELLPRLVATGKYEIAELGSYARQDDPRVQEFIAGRWRFYGVMPTNEEENRAFQQQNPHPRTRGQNTNQFGEYKFAHAVADFKPDIVIDIRDWWMLEFQERNIFRPWYKWIVMPTVDAEPQQEEWIQSYENANMVLAYSDYGIHTLRRQSSLVPSGKRAMKIFPKPMRPGVDINSFKPTDKKTMREHWNLATDIPIIGTVMRNQSLRFNAPVQTLTGYKTADTIVDGDRLLTSQGRYMPVINVWSYQAEKPYTRLTIFGNNIDGPSATSEHKFHFESGKHAIGDTQAKERIKMPVSSLIPHDNIDVATYLSPIDHWKLEPRKLTYDWRGGHAEIDRYVTVDQDLMRLFGWYLAEGWISNNGKTIQFGLNTNEQNECDEIVDIIKRKFNSSVTINDDKEFDSRTLSWSSHVHAKWFVSLFGTGSRNKKIPYWLKADPRAIHMAIAYLEGDGSFYSPTNKNGYVLASSFSSTLAYDIRDILLSHGIFTTIGQSLDHEHMKTNIGIYGQWAQTCALFAKHNTINDYVNRPKGQNWRNNVEFVVTDDQSYFLVPVIQVSNSVERGPFYDFEVQEDYTYNCAGYACDNSRKLYPDLIDAFALMKNKYKGDPQVDKAVLMIHSCWPDNVFSYDYPRHIFRLDRYDWIDNHKKGIRGDVLQTLFCHSCNQASVTFAANLFGRPLQEGRIKMPCSYCGQTEASPPNTSVGFGREDLAKLYNLMDLYVQCSICEGDGMPIQEAKACGVPTLVVDYTAMREKGRYPDYSHFKESDINERNYTCHKGGDVINVGRYYYEPETSCKRALPDIADLALKMRNMINDPERLAALGKEARECVEENYDWDKLWHQWEYVLDNVKIIDRAETWDSPIAQIDEIRSIPVPANLSDEQFVSWLYLNVLKYPSVDTDGAKMWISHLQQGVTRDQLMQQFVSIGNQQSSASKLRDQVRLEIGGVTQTTPRKPQEFV